LSPQRFNSRKEHEMRHVPLLLALAAVLAFPPVAAANHGDPYEDEQADVAFSDVTSADGGEYTVFCGGGGEPPTVESRRRPRSTATVADEACATGEAAPICRHHHFWVDAFNHVGMRLYRYNLVVRWCYNRARTRILSSSGYSERWPSHVNWFIRFADHMHGYASPLGSVSQYISTSGRFEACMRWCFRSYHPRIAIRVYATGAYRWVDWAAA
jgi:hypothetical protein